MARLTPDKEYVFELSVLGSRFIGILSPLLEEVESLLAKAKELYPKATHYCYALRDGPLEKASDDGEPSRSAGLPLLTLLRQKGLDEVILIVIRYFGGTKLGLPRLSRTYREVGEKLIEQAAFAEIIEGESLMLEVSYSDFDRFKYLIGKTQFTLKEVKYGEVISLTALGDAKILEDFVRGLPFPVKTLSSKKEKILRRV